MVDCLVRMVNTLCVSVREPQEREAADTFMFCRSYDRQTLLHLETVVWMRLTFRQHKTFPAVEFIATHAVLANASVVLLTAFVL